MRRRRKGRGVDREVVRLRTVRGHGRGGGDGKVNCAGGAASKVDAIIVGASNVAVDRNRDGSRGAVTAHEHAGLLAGHVRPHSRCHRDVGITAGDEGRWEPGRSLRSDIAVDSDAGGPRTVVACEDTVPCPADVGANTSCYVEG